MKIRGRLARLMGELKISGVLRDTGLSKNTVALMYKEAV